MRPGPWLAVCAGLFWSGALAADSGDYLLHVAGCPVCHTAEGGEPLAGGRAIETPFGTFYSPNITPDRETGIGNWSKSDFIRAVKHGRAPDGSAYFPVFPYPSYRRMTDEDAGRIYDYLMTTKPVSQAVRDHDLRWWLFRWMMKPWQWWFEPKTRTTTADQHDRGRYLVAALGHCGECHTPRNWAGALDNSHYLVGAEEGPDGDPVPNITPDCADGIGKWDADDLGYFLETGQLPDGDYVGGAMTDVVDEGTSKLTGADRKAVVEYLRSIPALPSP